MSADDLDTSRSAVKTYVPAYQKDEWRAHADELDMSQSEFVRAMVQAGRRSFDPEQAGEQPSGAPTEGAEQKAAEAGSTAERGDREQPPESLDEQVLEALSRHEYLSWDDLLAELTDDIEERLETALERLQRENRVGYRGRHGGYALLGDDGQ